MYKRQEYGIEVFADIKKDIMSNSIVQTVVSLLDVVIEKYRSEDVFTLLKSGFGDLTPEELAELENYCIKYKIKGSMWKKPFRRGKGEYGEAGLLHMEELRREIIKNTAPLENLLKETNTGDFIKDFYRYLKEDLKLPEKIASFAKEQEEKGLAEFADETRQVWDSIITILEQFYEIMGGERFEPADFKELFAAGLSQVEIGLIPPTEDGLMMGTMQRSRSGRIKALVVIGEMCIRDRSVEIDPEDLKVDTYRASGAGGQHVNKTDSAIRITHLPTNIVVTCQNERSQHQNREVAMKILMSKLIELKEQEHKETLKELKGDYSMNTWGSQIRSYVFQPYTMVKDHRTGAETANVNAVMDGDIDYFINEKLKNKE